MENGRSVIENLLKLATNKAMEERANLQVELKTDGSLVTNVDKAVDNVLLHATEHIPGFEGDYYGEEVRYHERSSEGVWLVDPIDGTTNFAYGNPLWGISIAYMRGDKVIAGGIALPDLHEVYLAEAGEGAWLNGKRLPKVQPGPIDFFAPISACDGIVTRLRGSLTGKPRCSGAFVIDGTFTAMGRYRALYGLNECLYDVAAALLLCREVGMEASYLDGSPFEEARYKRPSSIEGPWRILPRLSD